MTDPVLAALLADPDPAARLIAADRAAEAGDELLEAWLRLTAGWPNPTSSFAGDIPYYDVWAEVNDLNRGLVLRSKRVHKIRWQWFPGPHGPGWVECNRYRGDCRLIHSKPSERIRAAVLAALRRQLAGAGGGGA